MNNSQEQQNINSQLSSMKFNTLILLIVYSLILKIEILLNLPSILITKANHNLEENMQSFILEIKHQEEITSLMVYLNSNNKERVLNLLDSEMVLMEF